MSKNVQLLLRLCLAGIVIVIGNYVIAAQETLTGTWRAEKNDFKRDRRTINEAVEKTDKKTDENKIHLNFSYQTSRGGSRSHGSAYEYGDLQNLTRLQAEGSGAVNFRLVREAGTIDCEGSFQMGKGAGTFRFTANPQFAAAMKERGFDFEKPSKNDDDREPASRLLTAAIINVTTALAADLKSANFPNLDLDDLFKASIFKIDAAFIREMKATGFPDLEMEDLVKARIFKIDADFVRRIVALGFKKESFESLVRLSIFKITPEYLREMQSAGFADISSEEAVKLRIFKVTPEFIREMNALGLTNLSVEQATKLRIFNIDAAFVRRAKSANAPLQVESLVERRIGVRSRDDN